eukprot:6198531-Pleurochrysis_carterae.AAC.3
MLSARNGGTSIVRAQIVSNFSSMPLQTLSEMRKDSYGACKDSPLTVILQICGTCVATLAQAL